MCSGAGLRMIIDLFQWCLQAIEQVLYTVDEWLLFRTGESRLVLAAKAVLGGDLVDSSLRGADST